MGFPVGNQVDFMLPLLGLKAMLGSAVVAHAAAAQDDDDGPHQPEPWGQGGRAERHTGAVSTSQSSSFPNTAVPGRRPPGQSWQCQASLGEATFGTRVQFLEMFVPE